VLRDSLGQRLIDSCITQLKAQGPSRTCNESKEDEEESTDTRLAAQAHAITRAPFPSSHLARPDVVDFSEAVWALLEIVALAEIHGQIGDEAHQTRFHLPRPTAKVRASKPGPEHQAPNR